MEAGKVADLCVLRENLFDLDAHDIPNVRVRMTVLDGRVVFESDGSIPDPANPVSGQVASHYGPRTPIAALAFHGHTTGCAYDSLVVPG